MQINRQVFPWWLRIAIKIFLSRLPIPYSFWKKLGIFEHGDMNEPKKAISQYLEHALTANLIDVDAGKYLKFRKKITVLELGPGDSLATAVISKSLKAEKTWLVDSGSFARYDSNCSVMGSALKLKGLYDPFLGKKNLSFNDYLFECNSTYLTQGVDSLLNIPNDSVDYCFSNAVLEHIPKHDFNRMIEELYRILKAGSICVHRIDLRDHLGGALNNLRFSESIWESSLLSKSGFYTNRIRFCEMTSLFEKVGFYSRIVNIKKWETLPTDRIFMNSKFASLSDEDLRVKVFDLVLKK